MCCALFNGIQGCGPPLTQACHFYVTQEAVIVETVGPATFRDWCGPCSRRVDQNLIDDKFVIKAVVAARPNTKKAIINASFQLLKKRAGTTPAPFDTERQTL
jgi:hypothetical protein